MQRLHRYRDDCIFYLLLLQLANASSHWTSCLHFAKGDVLCYNGCITKVPQSFVGEEEVTQLILRNNIIRTIESCDLERYESLRKLIIRNCQTEVIIKDALEHLVELEVLDFSLNILGDLPDNIFLHNEKLRVVSFQNNLLDTIPKLPLSVEHADFSYCSISHLLPFMPNSRLKYLNIDHNNLHRTSADVFSSLHNIHTVLLIKNPWQCESEFYIFVCEYFRRNITSTKSFSCHNGNRIYTLNKFQIEKKCNRYVSLGTTTNHRNSDSMYNINSTQISVKEHFDNFTYMKSIGSNDLNSYKLTTIMMNNSSGNQTFLLRSEPKNSNEENNCNFREVLHENASGLMKNYSYKHISRTIELHKIDGQEHIRRNEESSNLSSTEIEHTKSNGSEKINIVIVILILIGLLLVLIIGGCYYFQNNRNKSGTKEQESNANCEENAMLAQTEDLLVSLIKNS